MGRRRLGIPHLGTPAAAVPTMIAARQSGATRRSESPSGTAATAGKRKAGTSSTGSAARSHAAEGPSRRCSLTPADGTAQTQPSDRRAAMAGGKWRSRAERTAAAPRSAATKKATPPSTCAFDGAGSEGASWQSDRAGDRLAGRDWSWARRCKQAAGRRRARRVAQCMCTQPRSERAKTRPGQGKRRSETSRCLPDPRMRLRFGHGHGALQGLPACRAYGLVRLRAVQGGGARRGA